MATKGQKFNSYTNELKKEIMDYARTEGNVVAGKKFNMSHHTIRDWFYKERNSISPNKELNKQKKEMDSLEEKYEILKKLHEFYKSTEDKK
ncbi:hypothetical protein [Spiroplasma alleghenense]|uniref:Transposase n=1 Tax=Spiroplasma alleghenense TaxID=216931 RepID=A0A345Z2V3_9MOLU|nr:hypothetical protein [Spiroplasma alleghenense]AXK50932.1 hypothetical protein SALLE_v1c02560 [Spiroplasma alleghenense]AXK51560.1 hypothetical protein SALLE_v1c08900 [Spiroplasma alleghenense]AXK51642.1 hypothetical protein SALLE_v1c09720 [Spiroplasma alleghenense]